MNEAEYFGILGAIYMAHEMPGWFRTALGVGFLGFSLFGKYL